MYLVLLNLSEASNKAGSIAIVSSCRALVSRVRLDARARGSWSRQIAKQTGVRCHMTQKSAWTAQQSWRPGGCRTRRHLAATCVASVGAPNAQKNRTKWSTCAAASALTARSRWHFTAPRKKISGGIAAGARWPTQAWWTCRRRSARIARRAPRTTASPRRSARAGAPRLEPCCHHTSPRSVLYWKSRWVTVGGQSKCQCGPLLGAPSAPRRTQAPSTSATRSARTAVIGGFGRLVVSETELLEYRFS